MKRPPYVNPNAKTRSAAQVERDSKKQPPERRQSQPAPEHGARLPREIQDEVGE